MTRRSSAGLAVAVFVSTCVAFSTERAAAFDLTSLEAGLVLAENGDYEACGQEWQRVANELATQNASSATESALDTAGLAFVAASRCFESGRSARAYASWADGIRVLLEAGTTWIDLRQRVVDRLVTTETQLAQQQVDEFGGDAVLDLEATFLYRLDATLDLLSFVGPRAGLQAPVRTEEERERRSNPQRAALIPAYIPRVFVEEDETTSSLGDPLDEHDVPLGGSIYWQSEERVRPAIFDYENDLIEETTPAPPIEIGGRGGDSFEAPRSTAVHSPRSPAPTRDPETSKVETEDRFTPTSADSNAPFEVEGGLPSTPTPGPGPWYDDDGGNQGASESREWREYEHPAAVGGFTDSWADD